MVSTKNKNVFLITIKIISQHHKIILSATVNHFSTKSPQYLVINTMNQLQQADRCAILGYASAVVAYNTPRDTGGHDTHTLSTIAGSPSPAASMFGFGNGTAIGGSPRAHVAAYRVCCPPVHGSRFFDADILAAFDAAIHDGVHVLSLSFGGKPGDYFNDGIAIGSFHAVRRGITVVCSARNSGPGLGIVSKVAPWIVTTGASTMDREFSSYFIYDNAQAFAVSPLARRPHTHFWKIKACSNNIFSTHD
jgi:subtilisin family serine protease